MFKKDPSPIRLCSYRITQGITPRNSEPPCIPELSIYLLYIRVRYECIKFRMHCPLYVGRYTWQSQTKTPALKRQGAYYTRSSQTPGSHVSCSLLLYYYYRNAKCIKPIWLCRTTDGNEFFFRGIYMTTTHPICVRKHIRRHASVTRPNKNLCRI